MKCISKGGLFVHYDHIVVGAGSMGAAAGYYLAKLGKRVLLIDAFNPPHDAGSHHGDTRLIRYAYGEGEFYVPFVLRARQLWEELEQESGKEIFLQTGIINVGHQDDAFLKTVQKSAVQFQLPLSILNAEEAMAKWPGISLPEDFIACYEETSGVLKTDHAIASYIELALKHGATLKFDTKVTSIDAVENCVTVTTAAGECFTATNIIVTAGAWAKDLLAKTELALPLRPIRKTFAWYEAEETLFCAEALPGFSFQLGEESYYGFPSIEGAGLKVGRHDLGEDVIPDEEKTPFGEVAGDQEDLDQFLRSFMPKVGPIKYGKTCMYSMTPDEDFIIDRHPHHANILIAAGFSGHGFKFASAVGEVLSELATNKPTPFDLSAFSIARFN